MNPENLEAKTKNKNINPAVKKAMKMVGKKISEIDELLSQGHGPFYIKKHVFGEKIGYTMLLHAYENLTGKRLSIVNSPKMDLSRLKGPSHIPSYLIDAVIDRIFVQDDTDSVHHNFYSNHDHPIAIQKF